MRDDVLNNYNLIVIKCFNSFNIRELFEVMMNTKNHYNNICEIIEPKKKKVN